MSKKFTLNKFRRNCSAIYFYKWSIFTITLVVERMSNQFFTRAILSGYEHTSISWSYFCYYFIYFLQCWRIAYHVRDGVQTLWTSVFIEVGAGGHDVTVQVNALTRDRRIKVNVNIAITVSD